MSISSYEGRYEFKYALPLAERDRILAAAQGAFVSDKNAAVLPSGRRGYDVHSLYFDTPDLTDYFERLAERRVRNRLRVRTYGALGQRQPVFLENKRKYRDKVMKHRAFICDADTWCGDAEGTAPWHALSRKLSGRSIRAMQSFSGLVDDGRREPKTVVHYCREPFVSLEPGQGKVRMTFDYEVTATTRPRMVDLFAPPDVYLLPKDWMVMELKYGDVRPHWMSKLCAAIGLRAVPVSKFGLSMVYGYRADRPREIRYFTPRPLRGRGGGLGRGPAS